MGAFQLRSSAPRWARHAARALLVIALALGAGLAPPALQLGSVALADGACAVWSSYPEQDGTATNLTATACASTTDDFSVIGLQCLDKRPQLRYYPGEGMQDSVRNRAYLDVTLVINDQTFIASMRYDAAVGVFTTGMSAKGLLLQALQSGWPVDLSTDTLGMHRFRLVGSTAAIAAVMTACGVTDYIGPPPPVEVDDPVQ